MTPETISARIAQLNQLVKLARAEAEDAQARVHALSGAIQDCEFWLGTLSQSEQPPEPAK